jgi:hypothetical protein
VRTLDFETVSHPSLGLPPVDPTAGHPAGAARLTADRLRIAGRALEVGLDLDPTLRERYDELGLRRLLNDAAVYLDAIARALATGDPDGAVHWAETSAPVYRRRRVPMDDLVTLGEGLRRATASVLTPEERAAADRAIDAGNARYHALRRLGGDARRRNPILAAIYKGG